jgi:hypothetical protein
MMIHDGSEELCFSKLTQEAEEGSIFCDSFKNNSNGCAGTEVFDL